MTAHPGYMLVLYLVFTLPPHATGGTQGAGLPPSTTSPVPEPQPGWAWPWEPRVSRWWEHTTTEPLVLEAEMFSFP